MVQVKWVHTESKRVIIRGDGFSAVFHFVPGVKQNIPKAAWKGVSKKMSDSLTTGKMVIITKEKKKL